MPKTTEPATSFQPRPWVIAGIVGSAIALAYANGLRGPFLFDDIWTIQDQMYIRAPAYVPALFGLSPPRFLTMLSFAVTYWLAELWVVPYHAVNVLLHGLNTWLVYRLLTRWMPRRGHADGFTRMGVAIATLGFALTPVHTQVVTYVTGRAALLGTAWLLLCVLAHGRARETAAPRRRLGWFAASLGCYVAGNFSKEIASVAPAIIIAWELWGRSTGPLGPRIRAAARTWPYFLVLAGVVWYRGAALGGQALPVMPRSVGINLLTQSFVTWRYALLEFVPVGLTIDHDVRAATGWGDPRVWVGVVLWLGALGAAFAARRTAPWITLGLAWFGIGLLPDSSVIPMQDIMADHRSYLAGIGLWAIAGGGWTAWMRALRGAAPRGRVRLALAVTVLVPMLLAWGTVLRNTLWDEPLRLWQEAVHRSPGRARPLANLAAYYLERKDYPRAIEAADRALALEEVPGAYLNRGVAYVELGDFERAESDISTFLNLYVYERQAWVTARGKLARGQYNLGLVHARQGRYEAAAQCYERARTLNPLNRRILNNLGVTYERLGAYSKAESAYAQAIVLPGNPGQDWLNLYRVRGLRSAEETLTAEILAHPRDAYAQLRMGVFQEMATRPERAVVAYRRGLALADPADPLPPVLLANLLRFQGNLSEASTFYKEALRRDPHHAEALWWYGQILIAQGLPFEARSFLERARAADPDAGRPGWRAPRVLRDGRDLLPPEIEPPSPSASVPAG